MATQIQFRRGTKSQHNSFTGATAEVTVNTTDKSLHVHDGTTQGGFELARANLSNHSGVGVLTATTFSGNVTGNINSSGISTLNTVVVGGATTALVVNGNARVTGILTVGTSSLTLDGVNDRITVGTGLTITSTEITIGSITIGSGSLTGTATSTTNIPNLTGDITSTNTTTTLATVNSNVGTFGSQTLIPVVTVNAKGLVTAVTTAAVGSGLTVSGDSGSENIDLLSETLTISGGTNLTSSAASNTVTVNLDPNISLTSVVASGIVTATSGFSGNVTGNLTGEVNAPSFDTNASGVVVTGIVTATSGFVGNVTGTATSTTNIPNLTGDITSINLATTLATVNSNVGSFGSQTLIPVVTVNAKGLVTSVSTAAVGTAITVSGDSGSVDIDLLTETLTISGGTNLTSVGSGNTVTVNLDDNISLTGVIATNGTITNLTGTAGTITTFDSTTSTITNGTITNLTGTAGTITTFDSTVGTITNLSATNINASGIVTAAQFVTGASGSAIGINTNTISGPSTLILDPAGVGDNTGLVVIKGDLQIDGTTTTVNSTTVTVDDKNIVLGSGAVNDAAADGSGITIESGNGNKTFQFEDTGDNLGSSENLNVATGKVYKVNNTEVLSSTTLGSGVVNSSLTSVGTLTNLSVGNVNSSGIITATTFVGALTGTATSTTNIPNLTGDITSTNTVTTLATVNSNVGSFGSGGAIPTITVNAKGLITGVTTTAVNPANDGTLTLAVSGTGLSGSASFTANQSGSSSFTVTSNATSANTNSTIVARDGSGNFSAGTITASLTGTATSTTNIPNLTGDITSANTATTLATVNSNVGSFGNGTSIPTITVNAKGLITGVTTTAVSSGLTLTDDTTTNASRFLTFTSATSGSISAAGVSTSKLIYNPSTGAVSATVFNSTSDINLKENIKIIENPIEKVSQLNGVSFDWKDNHQSSAGVIAQDVEKVLPEIIGENDGSKSVNYNGLIGLLIEAIKEQQKQIDELKANQ
jgi:hypothetical protein